MELKWREQSFEFERHKISQIIGDNRILIKEMLEAYTDFYMLNRYNEYDVEYYTDFIPTLLNEDDCEASRNINILFLNDILDIDKYMLGKQGLINRKIIEEIEKLKLTNHWNNLEKAVQDICSALNDDKSDETLKIEWLYNRSKLVESLVKNIEHQFVYENRKLQLNRISVDIKIKYFLNLLDNVLNYDNSKIQLIVYNFDIHFSKEDYKFFITKLFELVEKYNHLSIWHIPYSIDNRIEHKEIVEYTYFFCKKIHKFENIFDIFEEICINYPSNILPTESEVISAIMRLETLQISKWQPIKFDRLEVIQKLYLKMLNSVGVSEKNKEQNSVEIDQLEKAYLFSK